MTSPRKFLATVLGLLMLSVAVAATPAVDAQGPGELDAPTLTVTSYDNGVSLRWNRIDGAVGYWYTISIGNEIVRSAEIVETPGHPNDPHTEYESLPFGTYTVRVRALNFLGLHEFPEAGPWSNTVTTTVGDDGAPGPVQNLQASCTYWGPWFGSFYLATWSPPTQGSEAVEYLVSATVNGQQGLSSRDTSTAGGFLASGACSNTSVKITVVAIDAEGDEGPPRAIWVS